MTKDVPESTVKMVVTTRTDGTPILGNTAIMSAATRIQPQTRKDVLHKVRDWEGNRIRTQDTWCDPTLGKKEPGRTTHIYTHPGGKARPLPS